MAFIYESPDGGKTVFKRKIGEGSRTLHWTNDEFTNGIKEIELWKDIRIAAKTNPALREMLDQVETFYHLSKNDQD